MTRHRVTTDTETITPKQAAEYLEMNVHNRPEKPTKQAEWARAMDRGEWKLTGESIKFSHPSAELNGHRGTLLLDGQNRLKACIRAKKPFTTLVVRGLEPDTQETMDQGSKRTFGDSLSLRGYKNATALGAVVRGVFLYRHTGNPVSVNRGGQAFAPTYGELAAMIEAEPALERWAAFGRSFAAKDPALGLGGGMVGALAFLFAEKADEDYVLTFFEEILYPPSDTAPTTTLRRRLLRSSTQVTTRTPPLFRAAFVVKAWNAWLLGERPSKLLWRAGTKSRDETFPTILGPVES